jgi:hypothetical protein
MKSELNTIKIAFGLLLTMSSSICLSSEYSGPVRNVNVYTSYDGKTKALVTVNATKINGSGLPCEAYTFGGSKDPKTYFIFDLIENDSKSKAWFSQLQIAKALGKNIFITGGTCVAGAPAHEIVYSISDVRDPNL